MVQPPLNYQSKSYFSSFLPSMTFLAFTLACLGLAPSAFPPPKLLYVKFNIIIDKVIITMKLTKT